MPQGKLNGMSGQVLGATDIAFYRGHGYIIIENAVTPEELAELQRVTRDFIERSRQVAESDEVFDLDEGHGPGNPRQTRIKLPTKQHPRYDQVLRSERMRGYFKSLLGPNVVLQTSKLNTTAPGGGGCCRMAPGLGAAVTPRTA